MWMVYSHNIEDISLSAQLYLKDSFITLFLIISILVSILVWWILLAHENRKRAEDELEKQYEILKVQQLKSQQQAQMIEQTHDSVISTDLDGIITSFNHGSEILLEYTADEMIGKHITTIYLEEDYSSLGENIAILMHNGEYNTEVRLVKKSQEVIEADLSLSILKDSNGKPTGMVGYSQDIT